MPGKSHRKREKRSLQSKRREGGQSQPTMLTQQPASTQTHEPASPPVVPPSSTGGSTPMAGPLAARYPYVAAELKAIGILTGIMLIILIVLALVLH